MRTAPPKGCSRTHGRRRLLAARVIAGPAFPAPIIFGPVFPAPIPEPYFREHFRLIDPLSILGASGSKEQRSLPQPRGLGTPNLAHLRLLNLAHLRLLKLARSESRRPAAPARQSLQLRPAGLCPVKAARTATPRAGARRPAVITAVPSECIRGRANPSPSESINRPSPSTIRVH